jgi:hypothetical protein
MESQLEIPVSLNALTRGFTCGQDRVTQALLYGQGPSEARRPHLALSDDAKREILMRIEI